MIGGFDFSMSAPLQCTVLMCTFFPFVLMFITKIRKLTQRNATQFFLSYLVVSAGWVISLVIINKVKPYDIEELCVGFFLYHAVMLVYLEIWSLLSRGYTIGLLLTFYKADRPLNPQTLASLYRGGEGIDWLIKHRIMGLESAKLVHSQSDTIALTKRGVFVAFLYNVSILFFGLRYSG